MAGWSSSTVTGTGRILRPVRRPSSSTATRFSGRAMATVRVPFWRKTGTSSCSSATLRGTSVNSSGATSSSDRFSRGAGAAPFGGGTAEGDTDIGSLLGARVSGLPRSAGRGFFPVPPGRAVVEHHPRCPLYKTHLLGRFSSRTDGFFDDSFRLVFGPPDRRSTGRAVQGRTASLAISFAGRGHVSFVEREVWGKWHGDCTARGRYFLPHSFD